MRLVRRSLDGPAQEYLSREQAARWMGIGARLFQMLVDEGELPQGLKFGHKTVKWHWLDILAAMQIKQWRDSGRWVKK